MKKIHYQKYFLFFTLFLIAYLISELLVGTVFVSYSPKVRPNLGNYIVYKLTLVRDAVQGKETIVSPRELEEYADYIAPGVKAAETTGSGYTEFEIDNIIWEKHTITLSTGEEIIVEVPKGQEPPDVSHFEGTE